MVRGGLELLNQQGASILYQFLLQNEASIVDYKNDVPTFQNTAAIEAGEFLLSLAPYAMLTSGGSTTRVRLLRQELQPCCLMQMFLRLQV